MLINFLSDEEVLAGENQLEKEYTVSRIES